MSITREPFGETVARAVKMLRPYALRLTKDATRADDLMQDTVLRALAAEHTFQVGTNLSAWLTTIMRNTFLNGVRKKTELEDVEGVAESRLSVEADDGSDGEELDRLQRAMRSLPAEQREALELVMVQELGYEDAARRQNVDVGTIKSRVHRAKQALEHYRPGAVPEVRTRTGLRYSEGETSMRVFDVSGFTPVKVTGSPGPRPDLRWVPIWKMRVDERYQREVLERGMMNIRRIAASFDWKKFTPVITAWDRAADTYSVVDGQHRTYGAALCALHAAELFGATEVPCMVIEATLAEQAAAFAGINGSVTRIHELQIHASRVAAGDPEALSINAVCVRAGVKMRRSPVPVRSLKPGQTIALGSIKIAIRLYGEAAVTLALRIIMARHGGDRGVLTAALIKATCNMVHALQDRTPREMLEIASTVDLVEEHLQATLASTGSGRATISLLEQRLLERFR